MSVSAKGPSSGELDDYANSMFRFERLHDGWIDRCADYLHHLFGDRLAGATVLDYAFGRGNWSMAFHRAGAGRVIAIDASRGNVERFGHFVAESGIDTIDVVHGNIVETPLDVSADLLWVYGVFHHVPDTTTFLEQLRRIATDDAIAYFYAYDAFSLRQLVVDACRQHAQYGSEAEFRAENLLYTPAARRRVQDDLTAPHIGWYSVDRFVTDLSRHGFHAVRRDVDFGAFGRGAADEEFQPHQLLCQLREDNGVRLAEPERPHASDVELLRSMIACAFDATPPGSRRSLAIGLANTHFTAVAGNDFERVLREDFLYLLHALVACDATDGLPEECSDAVELALASVGDHERSSLGRDDRSIDRLLRAETIRI